MMEIYCPQEIHTLAMFLIKVYMYRQENHFVTIENYPLTIQIVLLATAAFYVSHRLDTN